jgi:hypothetical protein
MLEGMMSNKQHSINFYIHSGQHKTRVEDMHQVMKYFFYVPNNLDKRPKILKINKKKKENSFNIQVKHQVEEQKRK